MRKTYRPVNICASQIDFNIENGIVKDVEFQGGCSGNLRAMSTLVEGMKAEEIIKKLRHTTCQTKNTSCADQLAQALEMHLDG